MRDVINKVFVEKDGPYVWLIAGFIVLIYTAKGLAGYFSDVILAKIGNNIVARNQKRMYRHILKQSLTYFDANNVGILSTNLTLNAQSARSVLDLLITSVGRDAAAALSLSAVMVYQEPFLSIFAAMTLPPAVWGVSILVKRVRKIMKSEILTIAQIVTTLQESVLGIRIVKSFRMEDHMLRRMDAAVEGVETRSNQLTRINSRASPLMETLGGFAVAGIIVYGGYSVIYLGKDPGSFFSFITAMLLAYEPLKRLAKFNVQLEGGLVGVRMIYAILDTPPSIQDAENAPALVLTSGAVKFEKVTFAYRNAPVLDNLTLDFPAGKMSALVGPSGAGKSTMFSMIERFFDPSSGRVLIDGQDLKFLQTASVRDSIALVTQDTILFEGTVRENILHGRPGASEAEVTAAAIAANAHEFIELLPEGYATQVGEGGSRMSGGQRQRVAIARAMLRDAPILLLDEATSSLDSASEFAVQQALLRLMQGRTTIVIAHRLSTVRNADVIHVIDRGRLVQSGAHSELLAAGGMYLNLYELQFKNHAGDSA